MDVRIFDLDGSVARQPELAKRATHIVPLREWGPRLRLACAWSSFRRFERSLAALTGGTRDQTSLLTFVGSGDFHHVSLALVRRLPVACNLLVIDNHPDWMRGVPLLHCGTWLYHAARAPLVHRVFHVGGEVDFDNHYRWMAPWPMLHGGKIAVLPATRRYRGSAWDRIPHTPLRIESDRVANQQRIQEALAPWREELAARPLYVSLDRDALRIEDAVVNWDSGRLTAAEVLDVLRVCVQGSAGLAGMDVVGDWSPVRVKGMLRRLLHWTEHPSLRVDPDEAQKRNEQLNLALVELLVEESDPGGVTCISAARPQERPGCASPNWNPR